MSMLLIFGTPSLSLSMKIQKSLILSFIDAEQISWSHNLKQFQKNPPPVVLLSRDETTLKKYSKDPQYQASLKKPIDPETLRKLVCELVPRISQSKILPYLKFYDQAEEAPLSDMDFQQTNSSQDNASPQDSALSQSVEPSKDSTSAQDTDSAQNPSSSSNESAPIILSPDPSSAESPDSEKPPIPIDPKADSADQNLSAVQENTSSDENLQLPDDLQLTDEEELTSLHKTTTEFKTLSTSLKEKEQALDQSEKIQTESPIDPLKTDSSQTVSQSTHPASPDPAKTQPPQPSAPNLPPKEPTALSQPAFTHSKPDPVSDSSQKPIFSSPPEQAPPSPFPVQNSPKEVHLFSKETHLFNPDNLAPPMNPSRINPDQNTQQKMHLLGHSISEYIDQKFKAHQKIYTNQAITNEIDPFASQNFDSEIKMKIKTLINIELKRALKKLVYDMSLQVLPKICKKIIRKELAKIQYEKEEILDDEEF